MKEKNEKEREKLKEFSINNSENLHIASPNERLMKLEKEENDLEIEKIKMLNDFNNIFGISELNVTNTLNFIEKQKITNISIIIDKEKDLQIENNFHSRFEAVVENNYLIEYRNDPKANSMIFEYSAFSYFAFLSITICGTGLYFCLKRVDHYKNFVENYREIYNRLSLAIKKKHE